MPEIRTQICEVVVDSLFKKALTLKDARLDEIAEKCLEVFASYGLLPTQINAKSRDQAFNYELSFSLFNGNGVFNVTAEKLHVYLKNATSSKDVEIIEDCIAKVFERLPIPEPSNTTFTASAHATLSSAEELQQFLQRQADPKKGIVATGTIAYVFCESWPQEIRLTVDRSLAYPMGVFLLWSTTYPGKKPSRETLKTIKGAFTEAITKIDLTPVKET